MRVQIDERSRCEEWSRCVDFAPLRSFDAIWSCVSVRIHHYQIDAGSKGVFVVLMTVIRVGFCTDG